MIKLNIHNETAKLKILKAFKSKVQGVKPSPEDLKRNFDGSEGHWLEKKLGKKPDASNEADFWGYECKNDTGLKTSWGDWTPTYSIYHDDRFFTGKKKQDQFVKVFGRRNPQKNNRYSWSGTPVPTRCGDVSPFGQSLELGSNKDISIYYDFSQDKRPDKSSVVLPALQKNKLLLMRWHGYETSFQSFKKNVLVNNLSIFIHSKKKSLELKVKDKFGIHGWFKCIKKNGHYVGIEFGDALDFLEWISYFESGDIYFDTGMYVGNPRPYCQWRSNNSFWKSLVTDTYP